MFNVSVTCMEFYFAQHFYGVLPLYDILSPDHDSFDYPGGGDWPARRRSYSDV